MLPLVKQIFAQVELIIRLTRRGLSRRLPRLGEELFAVGSRDIGGAKQVFVLQFPLVFLV